MNATLTLVVLPSFTYPSIRRDFPEPSAFLERMSSSSVGFLPSEPLEPEAKIPTGLVLGADLCVAWEVFEFGWVRELEGLLGRACD